MLIYDLTKVSSREFFYDTFSQCQCLHKTIVVVRRFPLPGKRSSVIFFLFVNTTSIQQYLAAPLCFIDQSRDTILKEKMLPYSQQPFIQKGMQLCCGL